MKKTVIFLTFLIVFVAFIALVFSNSLACVTEKSELIKEEITKIPFKTLPVSAMQRGSALFLSCELFSILFLTALLFVRLPVSIILSVFKE